MDEAEPVAVSVWRAAVIRGDLTSGGVVLVLVGLGAAAAAGGSVLPPGFGLLGLAVALGGVVLVQYGRLKWRSLLAELVDAHEDDDPGPSPVPWIDEALWRARNGFDAALDPIVLLMSEVDPLVKGYGEDADGAFREPVLRPVTLEERELATVAPVPADAIVGEPGDAASVLEWLAGTPGRLIAVSPRWPICCSRPATLKTVVAADLHPKAYYLSDPPSGDAERGKGTHGFQCRKCGRLYATDPVW